MAKTLLSSVLAGICIAVGGTAYLLCESRPLGALLFCVGLFMVIRYEMTLYTGKIGRFFEYEDKYLYPVILVGNIIGTLIMASMLRCTRLAPSLTQKATDVFTAKTHDSLLSLFFLAMLCNVMINLAVSKGCHPLEDTIALLFGVTIFVFCGFEHCVADAFYMFMAGAASVDTVIRLLVVVAGNTVGGVLFYEGVSRGVLHYS